MLFHWQQVVTTTHTRESSRLTFDVLLSSSHYWCDRNGSDGDRLAGGRRLWSGRLCLRLIGFLLFPHCCGSNSTCAIASAKMNISTTTVLDES